MHKDLKRTEIEYLQSRIKGIKKLRLFVSIILTVCACIIVAAVIATSTKSDKVWLYVLCLGLVIINGIITYVTFSLAIKSSKAMENTLINTPLPTNIDNQDPLQSNTDTQNAAQSDSVNQHLAPTKIFDEDKD